MKKFLSGGKTKDMYSSSGAEKHTVIRRLIWAAQYASSYAERIQVLGATKLVADNPVAKSAIRKAAEELTALSRKLA